MKSDLELLIEYYEEEKSALESSIKNYLLEHDYLYAHYKQEALWRMNSQIDLLKSFKDPLYNNKQHLIGVLDRMRDTVQKFDTNEHYKSIYQRRINEKENELAELNRQVEKYYFNDSHIIDDALFELYEGRISKLRMYLSKEDDFYLDFELSDNLLKISHQPNLKFDDYEDQEDSDNDNKKHPYPLEKLGFKWEPNGKELIYYYDMKGFKEALTLKVLLSRITYEIFSFGSWYHEIHSTIEYIR